MSEKNSILAFRKNAKGDLIFEINPENISPKALIKGLLSILLFIFVPLFRFFDFLATKRKLVIVSVGLGIGLGMSVLITQRPDTLQAFPSLSTITNNNIRAEKLSVSSIDLSVNVETGNVQKLFENVNASALVHDERSAELGSHETVVIAEVGFQNILNNLESATIGDEILVRGTNQGIYPYIVTEIRDMNAEYLPNVIAANDGALILYKSKNLLRTQLYMVIAQPVK